MISSQGCRFFFKKRTHPLLEHYITWTRTTQCPTVQTHTPHCRQEDQAYSKPVVEDSLYPMISCLLRHAQGLKFDPPKPQGGIAHDGAMGHTIKTRKHPRHGTQRVLQYPTNRNPAQSHQENAITVFGPRLFNSLPKYLWDIESVKTEKFKFELDKFL